MTITLEERTTGAMLGLACGDALGAQVEFQRRGSFPLQTDLTGGGPHRLAPGEWTDDTAMALGLADSLLLAGDWSPDLTMKIWLSWYATGDRSCTGECFDVGVRTGSALMAYSDGGMSALPGVPGYAEGNGSLMRVLPISLRYYQDPERALLVARQQSALTHGRKAQEACVLFTCLALRLLSGEPAAEVFADPCLGYMVRRRAAKVSSAGRAKDTIEAAVWCMAHTRTAESAIVSAANLGDDADTVAAVTGALAGAAYGVDALPRRWLELLAWRPRLEWTALELLCAGS